MSDKSRITDINDLRPVTFTVGQMKAMLLDACLISCDAVTHEDIKIWERHIAYVMAQKLSEQEHEKRYAR